MGIEQPVSDLGCFSTWPERGLWKGDWTLNCQNKVVNETGTYFQCELQFVRHPETLPSLWRGPCEHAGPSAQGLGKDSNPSSLCRNCCWHKGVSTPTPHLRNSGSVFPLWNHSSTWDRHGNWSSSQALVRRTTGSLGFGELAGILCSKQNSLFAHSSGFFKLGTYCVPLKVLGTGSIACNRTDVGLPGSLKYSFIVTPGVTAYSLRWYAQQGLRGGRDQFFPFSRWGNRGWRRSSDNHKPVLKLDLQSHSISLTLNV